MKEQVKTDELEKLTNQPEPESLTKKPNHITT